MSIIMDNFKYLGLFNYWAEGPVPPKVKEMPWATLIFKFLSTLGEISKIVREKVRGEVNDFDFALLWTFSNVISAFALCDESKIEHI